MKITPVGDRIVVSPIVPKEKTLASGLIVGPKSDSFPRGTVVAVPVGYEKAKIGDEIAYVQHFEASIDGEAVFLVDFSQIVAVIGRNG